MKSVYTEKYGKMQCIMCVLRLLFGRATPFTLRHIVTHFSTFKIAAEDNKDSVGPVIILHNISPQSFLPVKQEMEAVSVAWYTYNVGRKIKLNTIKRAKTQKMLRL